MVNISNLSTTMLNFKTHISTTFLLSGTKNFRLLQEDVGYGRKIKRNILIVVNNDVLLASYNGL